MKILLPLDIVHAVEPTIAQLINLVPLETAQVQLLYVREVLPAYENMMESVGNFADDYPHKLEEAARKQFAEAEKLLKGKCAQVKGEIVVGPPAMMIETVARDEQCDMTVLSPGKHSQVERFFVGSVSSKVIKHGPGTILLVRSQAPVHQLDNVLVAYDGSKHAKKALSMVADRFKVSASTKVSLVHVVSIPEAVKLTLPVEFVSGVEQNMVIAGEALLAEGKVQAGQAQLKNVATLLKDGDPATELIAQARSVSAELLVLGAQGHTAVEHFLLGSVTSSVLPQAPCSVAVIKA